MKRYLLIFTLLATLFVSCSKNDNNNQENSNGTTTKILKLSKNLLEVNNSAIAKTSISVTTNQTWDFTNNNTWIKAAKNGNVLEISIEANTAIEPRQANIIIKAGELSETLTIKQEGLKSAISLSPKSINTLSEGGEYTIYVTSSFSWTVEYDKAEWFTVVPDTKNNIIIITIQKNTDLNPREVFITVKDTHETTAQLQITQKGGPVVFENVNFDKLPLGFTDYDNCSVEKVKMWEENTKNSIFSEDLSSTTEGVYWFNVTNDKYSVLARTYFIGEDGSFDQGSVMYGAVNFFYDEKGETITKEFESLLEKEGYELFGKDKNTNAPYYKNETTNTVITFEYTRYEEVNNSNPIVDLLYFNLKTFLSSSSL